MQIRILTRKKTETPLVIPVTITILFKILLTQQKSVFNFHTYPRTRSQKYLTKNTFIPIKLSLSLAHLNPESHYKHTPSHNITHQTTILSPSRGAHCVPHHNSYYLLHQIWISSYPSYFLIRHPPTASVVIQPDINANTNFGNALDYTNPLLLY